MADLDPIRTALSLLLFPFLLAGPIVRRKEMAEQLIRRVVSVANFAYGMRRFAIGLFKKVAIADTVGLTADTIFGLPPTQVAASARAWLGLLCFGLQIYFAVSAYSDMALGLGRMFGFRLSENFKWPYVSRSVHEFWEKWFSSLGDWMREDPETADRFRSPGADGAGLSLGRRLVRHALDAPHVGRLSRGVRRARADGTGEGAPSRRPAWVTPTCCSS